jgi:hypothetical protein
MAILSSTAITELSGPRIPRAIPALTLYFKQMGILSSYSAKGKALWSTQTNGSGAYHLQLLDNGELRLYNLNDTTVWTSKTPIPWSKK